MGWRIRHAQQKGIDVQQVVSSYAHHLTKDRKRARDNPRSLDALSPPDRYSLAVTQRATGRGVTWTSLGDLPHGIDAITVSATSFEAARNRCSVRELLEQRYKRELASALQREGLYGTDLAGRRAAMAAAIASTVSVADMDMT